MAIATISGSGKNRKTNFVTIHKGGRSFEKDNSTTHSQVKIIQNKLNSMGFSAGTADGIYGTNTYNAVKAFQSANNLNSDGKCGKLTLAKLENGVHLDTGIGGCLGIPFANATTGKVYSAAVHTGGGSLVVRSNYHSTAPSIGTVSNNSTQLVKKFSSTVQWYQISDTTSSNNGGFVDAQYVVLGSEY